MKKNASPLAKGGAYMGLAFVPAIGGWLGYQVGLWADGRLGTKWLYLVGLLLGLVASFYEVLRMAERIENGGKRNGNDKS